MVEKKRELFADALRTVAIIFVLIIHTTANYYVESYGTKSYYIILVISSITCSAVPIFYMLSGAFLINEKNKDYSKFYKKIIKVIFQTLFWTLVYLVFFKYYMNQDISIFQGMIKALFIEQVGHLWFMYPLIALYLLTPFISRLYSILSEKDKIILISIVLIIPAIVSTLQMKYWQLFSTPKFAILFPELGLFLCGKYIYDNKEKLKTKKVSILSFIGIVIGLISIICISYFYVKSQGISGIKPYFDSNKISNLLFIISLFVFIVSISNFLNKIPKLLKNIFTIIGSSSGGIYFIHMFFLYLFPNIEIWGLHFTQNQGRILYMLSGAVLYLVMSLIVVLFLRKIPIVNKTVK